MEEKMETTIVYWGYIGNNGQDMETTIVYEDMGILSGTDCGRY